MGIVQALAALLLFYNWKAAVVLGNLETVLAMLSSPWTWFLDSRRLPTFRGRDDLRRNAWEYACESERGPTAGPWCLSSGLLGALLGLAVPPREMVFLDAICIDQTNGKEKMRGGEKLKNSKKMLVIWDRTYCQRLWCLFELAAFLKTHKKSELLLQPLHVATLVIGTSILNVAMWYSAIALPSNVYLLVFGLLAFSCFYCALILSYYRNFESLDQDLRDFRLAEAPCYCCSINHKSARGQPIFCDRKIIKRCVEHWFGSVEDFEGSVKIGVKDALAQILGGALCPYPLFVLGTLTNLWAQMDFAAAMLLAGIQGSLVSSPMTLALAILFIRSTPGYSPCFRWLIGSLLFDLAALAGQGLLQILVERFGKLQLSALTVGVTFLPSLLPWRCATRTPKAASERTPHSCSSPVA